MKILYAYLLSESVTYKCGADPRKHKKTCPCKSLLGQVKYPAVPPGLVQKYTHSVRTDIRRPLFTERHLRLTYWVYPWHWFPDLKDQKNHKILCPGTYKLFCSPSEVHSTVYLPAALSPSTALCAETIQPTHSSSTVYSSLSSDFRNCNWFFLKCWKFKRFFYEV